MARIEKTLDTHKCMVIASGLRNPAEQAHHGADTTLAIQQGQLLMTLLLDCLVHVMAENSEKCLLARIRTRICPATAQVQNPEIRPCLKPPREHLLQMAHLQRAQATQMEVEPQEVPIVNHVKEHQRPVCRMQALRTT